MGGNLWFIEGSIDVQNTSKILLVLSLDTNGSIYMFTIVKSYLANIIIDQVSTKQWRVIFVWWHMQEQYNMHKHGVSITFYTTTKELYMDNRII